MIGTSKYSETDDHGLQLADVSKNDVFVFTNNDAQWDEEADKHSGNNQEQDDGMNDLANNTFASIDLDQQIFEDQQQLDGNRQAPSSFPDPLFNYDQPHGTPFALGSLNVDDSQNGNNGGDESYQQFFMEMVDSGIVEEDSSTREKSSFSGLDVQAGEPNKMSGCLTVPSVSKQSPAPTQVSAELDDVFASDEQFSMYRFQKQLQPTKMRTGSFNLQEPPRFESTVSTQAKLATENEFIDLELHTTNTLNNTGPENIPQASPNGFSARRQQHVARKDKTATQSDPRGKEATDKGARDGRASKRLRVTAEVDTVREGQGGGRRRNMTLNLAEVPKQLILKSNPVSQGGQVARAQPQNMDQATSILRPQPRMANQQFSTPRKPSLEKPGMGMFQLQSNDPRASQNVFAVNNQSFAATSHLDAFGPTPIPNPDRLQGPPSMIAAPPLAPAAPSPITPSLRFPFDVFKYPTGEHYTQYLGPQVVKILYENFYQDVTSIPLANMGNLPPTTLIDTAVHYFKMMNWDNPVQLNMIYLLTVLHHSQQTDLHQWLWELFRAASMVQRLNRQSPIILETIQTIKWQIIRLTLLLLKHDMTEFSTRENPVFGRKVGPAPWTVHHERTTIWQVLGIQVVKDEPRLWIDNFIQMAKAKFLQAGINPNESPLPVPEAEDEEGFI
ncbi:hypothetical protein ONS96_013547 [Cadophora gregata f. sp. sojae]|nr:hypothetical protein ONS96_013547 [Cadophora gregata f. sp. sojae]